MTKLEIPEAELDNALQLYEGNDEDALSYLGIQAERLELAEKRASRGETVPEWSSEDAIKKVLGPQRDGGEELARYARQGLEYADRLLARVDEQVRGALCDGTAVRKELKKFEGDTKAMIRAVASGIAAAILAGIPTLLAKAVVSVATTLAIVLLKKRLAVFCALGASASSRSS